MPGHSRASRRPEHPVLRSQIGQGVDDRPAQQPRAPYQPLGEVATRFLQRPFEGFSLPC